MTVQLTLAQEPEADDLLSRDAFALLVGMLLDQQFPMERAFAGPLLLAQRMGQQEGTRLDPAAVASADLDQLTAWMTGPPAVHRYPGSMAGRVRALAEHVMASYGGDAAALWTGAGSGVELRRRLEALPGFGAQKAKIFTALLGKQLAVRPDGWREAAGEYGPDGTYRSVADVRDQSSLERVRETKRALKAQAKDASGRRGTG